MLPLLFAALLLAPALAAVSRPRPVVARGDGIVRVPVNAIAAPPPNLRARQNGVEVENQRRGTRYAVDIEVGTPRQKLTLLLDTGSPDTWVNPMCDTANLPADCRAFPQFDFTKSTSLKTTNARDVLVYGIGNASVAYVLETVVIGSARITNQVIGIAFKSYDIPLGIFGISPPVTGDNKYPYVLDMMATQGLIKSRAFSLDLRGIDNPNGAIIFGGIDTGKYIGALAKRPMLSPQQSPGGANRYYVAMTGVGVTFPDGTTAKAEALSVPMFLDSGSTFSYLPTPIYQAFTAFFTDGQRDPKSNYYFVPCDVRKLAGSIDFYFGSKTIRVLLNDFIWEAQGQCVLGVLPNDDEPTLGDTFLRAAYVVFDQDNRNIHLAQAADCGTNLVAIGSGADAVPSSAGRCSAPPMPTAKADNADVKAARAPSNAFAGTALTGMALGPGPA
ncbi:aspartic peptidase domain-containing protein [Staphylotrichum tortipilum]|uniref:Aspartic peptidase domain-containing protein n=1 Tax=Staphylotrichum tortipilum TaxID=2831512 RepID=A0AAN6MS36_9PEZI|nr:aspartic peptidase domain-containing protein [Staphylotrichum longicolle]